MTTHVKKEVGTFVSVVVLCTLFWLSARGWIQDPIYSLQEWSSWVIPLLLLVVVVAILSVGNACLKDRLHRTVLALIPGILF